MKHLLTLTIFAPLAAAVLMALIPKGQRKLFQWGSLVFSLIVFSMSLVLFVAFNPQKIKVFGDFQFVDEFCWIGQSSLGYIVTFSVGLDGVSLLLLVLTTFLMPIVVLASWTQINKLFKEYYILLFVLETAMLGTFAATNLFVFFIFWEMILIPMFLIIGMWGSENRIYASLKFILYTALGSFMMLAAIIYLYVKVNSLAFTDLYAYAKAGNLTTCVQLYLFLAFALAFAIKVPMFPFHTWLPDAHVQAPTAGSVILAGVLLKMGSYGFLRLAMPLFPDAVRICLPYLITIAVISIIYGALVSYVQSDMKKLIAYSSISHLGYVMLGLFVLNQQGVEGSVLQMINHGISTGGLFLLVGIVYQRFHTREIASFQCLAKTMPKYATVFMIIALSSIGLPLTNGFIGEFLILVGAFQASSRCYIAHHCVSVFIPVVLAASGMIFSALYMLWMMERVFFGGPKEEDHGHHGGHDLAHDEPKDHAHEQSNDLTWAELAYFTPILVLIFWIGIYPGYFLNKVAASIEAFIAFCR